MDDALKARIDRALSLEVDARARDARAILERRFCLVAGEQAETEAVLAGLDGAREGLDEILEELGAAVWGSPGVLFALQRFAAMGLAGLLMLPTAEKLILEIAADKEFLDAAGADSAAVDGLRGMLERTRARCECALMVAHVCRFGTRPMPGKGGADGK